MIRTRKDKLVDCGDVILGMPVKYYKRMKGRSCEGFGFQPPIYERAIIKFRPVGVENVTIINNKRTVFYYGEIYMDENSNILSRRLVEAKF